MTEQIASKYKRSAGRRNALKQVGALGISGPIWRLSNQALHNSARIVQAAASQLSAEFGAKRTIKPS